MSIEILAQKRKEVIRVGDKIVGYLEDSKFIKVVYRSRHMLRQPPAWAVDTDVYDREVKSNATEIVVIDKESGLKYHTSVDTFDRLKGELDRGFGRQYYLTFNHWQVTGNRREQLGLWGGDNYG